MVQYGAGSRTSSPGFSAAAQVLYTACLPPLVTRMRDTSGLHLESLSVLSTRASFSAGRPPAGVYLWLAGSWHAATAASTMWLGVAKSGSPAPKPMTGSPAALRALAFASTAMVADSAMVVMRRESRSVLMGSPGWER